MNFKKIKKIFSYKYDSVLVTYYGIIFPISVLNGIAEYYSTGFSLYFLRDILNVYTSIFLLLLFKVSIINKKNLIAISVYTILAAIGGTFVIGMYDPNFVFESLFLKAEILIITLVFAIGLLSHYNKAIHIFIFNIIFIIFCYFTSGKDYPLIHFIFYTGLVSGASLVAYASQKRYVLLSKDIKSTTQLIELQNDELKEMNTSKDQLLRIIGHDLRTPFHQLSALVEMIAETEEEEERKEIQGLLRESAQKGSQLLEDLLKWGKLYKEESHPVLEKQLIADIVSRVIEFSSYSSKLKEITIINELPKSLELNINTTMTETVFRNLIANAVKFSNHNSYIIIQSRNLSDFVVISIIDNGVGMSKDQIRLLFDKDYTTSTQGTDNEKGTGYGLGIAKRLIERQNGKLEIKSMLNKGTIVSMYFPTK